MCDLKIEKDASLKILEGEIFWWRHHVEVFNKIEVGLKTE